LNRSAAIPRSTTSRKKPTRKTTRSDGDGPPPDDCFAPSDDEPVSPDWAIDVVRRVIGWQIEEIRMEPSEEIKSANVRARDARTLAELVRTLERLDALEKRREAGGRKSKPRDDRDIKAKFVRRLDQLLAAGEKGGVPAKPQRG
jgi:hypothetical protein